jgi:hypothetical protein
LGLLIAGLLFSEWFLASLLSGDGHIDDPVFLLSIRFFQFLCLVVGLFLLVAPGRLAATIRLLIRSKVAFSGVVGWTFAVTLARAIRFPNDYSEAHWLLDYRFGFMKRGLIGSLLAMGSTLFGYRMTPRLIAVLAGVVLFVFCLALFVVFVRLLRTYGTEANFQLMTLVFADRPYVAAVLQSAAILSHESYLLIGLPLVGMGTVLLCSRSWERGYGGRHVLALSVPVLVFAGLVVFQTFILDDTLLRRQLTEYLTSFDFVRTRTEGIARWQTTGFGEFLSRQFLSFDDRLLNPRVLAAVGPPLLAIVCFAHASFRLRPFRVASLLFLVAVLSALALHAIAWDTARISVYVIGGAFLGLWALTEIWEPGGAGYVFPLVALPGLVRNILVAFAVGDLGFRGSHSTFGQ